MPTLFEHFSSQDNLRQSYKYVCTDLLRSSLAVNPINHASLSAINSLGDEFFVALERFLREKKYAPERGFFVYIPKDNLGLRPVYIPSLIDRIVYQAIFNPKILGQKIDGQLSDKVCFGNRVNDNHDSESFLIPYFTRWDLFLKSQEKAFEKGYVWKLEIDIQQYYEHIPIQRLIQKLQDSFAIRDEGLLSILRQQLCKWTEYPELPKGIPQGPDASAILGNVYLSSLDKYAERELIGEKLRYFRYADDIVLMGREKKDVMEAIEIIASLLRKDNLNLNEKTKLVRLENTDSIKALRLTSDYDPDGPIIPDDTFPKIQEEAPRIVNTLLVGGAVERRDLGKLKYYLNASRAYHFDFLLKLIKLLSLCPSLTTNIIKYIGDGRLFFRSFGQSGEGIFINQALWDAYKNPEVSRWSRFWILKLLASTEEMLAGDIETEVVDILTTKNSGLFKLVAFYYQAIRNRQLDITLVQHAVDASESEVEKSIYSFFLFRALTNARTPVIRSYIEKALNSPSHEVNLIGCYLYQKHPDITIEEIDGPFASYLLHRRSSQSSIAPALSTHHPTPEYYIVRSAALTPFTGPVSDVFGLSRKEGRHFIDLVIPEPTNWAKVLLKMTSADMRELQIFYDGELLETADYVQLGFYSGSKQEKPDRQWDFLRALAFLSATDITQATAREMCRLVAINSKTTIKNSNIHQIKRSLVKHLRILFKTNDNPFQKRRDYYHPKFTILPESPLRTKEIWSTRLRKNQSQEPRFFTQDKDFDPEEADMN